MGTSVTYISEYKFYHDKGWFMTDIKTQLVRINRVKKNKKI